MRIEQYLAERFGFLPSGNKHEEKEVTPTEAADIGKSELNWCSKELGYLSTDIDSGAESLATKRVDRVREQLDYVEDLLDTIEEKEL